VKSLEVVYPDIDLEKYDQMALDLEFCMVKKNLGRVWPSLQEIIFFCAQTPDVLMMKRKSNWKAIEATSELEPVEEEFSAIAALRLAQRNFDDK
jgi:hypothetical protein